MTSGQKITFSLLLSMVIFAAFVVFANVRLFSELETRFYSGAKVSEKINHLDEVSESFDAYISNFLTHAVDYSRNHYISSYLEQNPSEKIVSERRRLTENLFKDFPALSGIRIIDRNGRNVHYSSFDNTDLLKQTGISKIYKNYYDIQKDSDEIDFNRLRVTSFYKVFVDSSKNRLVISLPFYLFGNVQAGVMLCYLNLYEIREELTSKNIIGYGENFAIFSDDSLKGGIVLGIPLNEVEEFRQPVLESFDKGGYNQPQKILTASDGSYWTLLSARNSKFINVCGAYVSHAFELSNDLIWLIYVSVFITVFLFLYLLFSLRGEPISTTKKKIRQLQAGIIEEYLSRKQDVDWSKMAEVLRLRKSDFVERLRNDLAKKSKRHAEEVNELLESAWNDIITVFEKYEKNASNVPSDVSNAQNPGISMPELRAMMEDVLKSSVINVSGVREVHEKTEEPGDLDEVEELEEEPAELDEVEELEEEPDDLDEVEELEEEPAELDEVEELEEEPGDLDEVEDLKEDPAELDEVEDLEEEPAELDEVEELEEESGDSDELEELEEDSDEPEPLEELPEETSDAGEVEEIPEVEEVGELEELPEYDEFPDEKIHDYTEDDLRETFYNVDNLLPGRNEYFEDSDAFIRSATFANVENLFAEEISLGTEYDSFNKKHQSDVMKFKIHRLSEMSEEELPVLDEAENTDAYFAMTNFGNNLDGIAELELVKEIKKATPPEVIKENDGVFQITENLDYTSDNLDKNFKTLVDSVLHKK